MKKHCINNNFEFIIYDLQKQSFFIEEQDGKLIEYENLFEFNKNYAINVVELNEIFELNAKVCLLKI